MRFMVESWDPSYGSPSEVAQTDSASELVDLEVEYAAADWKPLASNETQPPGSIIFIDGVRRFDAHMWFEGDESTYRGICATVAAGAVRCTADEAKIEVSHVERAVHTCAELVEPIQLDRLGEVYKVKPTKDDSSEILNFSVGNHMARIEDFVSESYESEELIIFDGPLNQRDNVAGVGYIKTQHVQYLTGDPLQCLQNLKAGERTPLFRIEGRFERWSWYLQLPITHGPAASAIVRLELPESLSIAEAKVRADLVTACLPRYVSEPFKESRAPQNLYPISGLERQLRRRLGDRDLLERGLRVASQT